MSKRSLRPSVRKAEMARCIDALRGAGVNIASLEVAPDGTFRILTSADAPPKASADAAFDAWERRHGKTSQD